MTTASRATTVRDFLCPNCGQHLAFENSVCLSCDSPVGFSLPDMAFLVIDHSGAGGRPGFVDAAEHQLCANLHLAECNWLVPVSPVRQLCGSCRLTRTRPADDDSVGLVGTVVVSDGFFPFRDGVDLCIAAGVTAIAQSGGSIRDTEVNAACNEATLQVARVYTGHRSFRH